jgi:hypothetical protein
MFSWLICNKLCPVSVMQEKTDEKPNVEYQPFLVSSALTTLLFQVHACIAIL